MSAFPVFILLRRGALPVVGGGADGHFIGRRIELQMHNIFTIWYIP